VSGAPVVVDTSKHVSTALLLRRVPDIDLRVVHLVRDPRGVAHSWSKNIKRVEATNEGAATMDRLHPGRVGLRWLWFNWAFSNMDRLDVPSVMLRYEDFVEKPAETLNQIFDFAEVDDIGHDIVSATGPTQLLEGHSVSGNPGRIARETVEIRSDEAWKRQMEPKMQRLVSISTKPMRRRYHYPEES